MDGYNDRRFRTEIYKVGDTERFSIFELTPSGVLITDFNERGEVLDQFGCADMDIYRQARAHVSKFILDKEVRFVKCTGSDISIKCQECKIGTIKREFDLIDPKDMISIHTMPIFVCLNCNKKFISVTEEYVSALVKRNPNLFENSEVEEKNKDWDGFIKDLRQYIISVFAAKKIHRIVFE